MSTQTARPEIVREQVEGPRFGWTRLVMSADHKAIGRMYIATALFFAAAALTELFMMRMQLLVPENSLIRPEVFDRLLSAYGVTALVLFALPLAIGLFSIVMPLQIGARGMALPRLHHLSYWLFLLGGVTIYASFLYSPSEAGTIALPELSETAFLTGNAVDAWLVGFGLALLGQICFAVSAIATLRGSRAPGLAWRRVPAFSWACAVISYTLLLVGSVMVAAIAMLIIDRNFGGAFFISGLSGKPVLYEHLSSIFLAGAYISVVIAALGALSEIIPAFSRQPQAPPLTVGLSFAFLAAFTVLAWMQNMVSSVIPVGFLYFAMLMALLAAVPAGLVIINLMRTLSAGRIWMRAPMRFALGSIVLTVIGLAGELTQAVVPVGWQLNNTMAAWGDTHAALIGAGVLGGFAALHYWFPKLSGRLLGETLGRASFWALLGGALLMIVPMWLAGFEGMPVDVYKYYGDSGLTLLNVLTSIGTVIFAIGFLAAMINAARSLTRGVEVGPDPWGGDTLEWLAPSPPPVHNFDLVPDVRSAEPLRDIREAVRRRETRWTPPPAVGDEEPEPIPVAAGEARSAEPSSGTAAAHTAPEAAPSDAPGADPGPGGPDDVDRPVA